MNVTTFSILFLVFVNFAVQAQNEQQHLRIIAEEYCQGIKDLPAVDTSSWWIETLDTELPAMTISDEAKAAFLKAEGTEFDEAMASSQRLPLQLFGEVFESCPTLASKRAMLQQVAGGEYYSLLDRQEWSDVLTFLREEVISEALVDEEKLLMTHVTQALRNSPHSDAFDTLTVLTSSDDIYPLLFTELSTTEPKVMGRYQLEEHDSELLMHWVMSNSPDSISVRIGMDTDYDQLCDRIEEVVDSAKIDLSEIDRIVGSGTFFNPRAETIDRLGELYGTSVINRAVLSSGATSVIFMRMFQECKPFRNLMRVHAFEEAMEMNNVVGEEKKMYENLMDDLCECFQISVKEESMKCFEGQMKNFGLTEENTKSSEAANNPEVERKMMIFQTLMPAIGAGCAPKFE